MKFKCIAALAALAILGTSASAVSLWDDKRGGLFGSERNFKVGDIIRIQIQEATNADHEWSQNREKEVTIGATAAAQGAGAGTGNLIGRFLPFMNGEYMSELETENESDRTLVVSALVAAEVVNVLPNGNLQLIARKVIRVNSEEQLIELTGNVRPQDVTPTNIVSSAALADANIKVNGTWRYGNDRKAGLLEKFFSFLTGVFF